MNILAALLPQKGVVKMVLTIYAVVATVVAVVAIIKAVKWKIATRAMKVYRVCVLKCIIPKRRLRLYRGGVTNIRKKLI